MKWDALAFQAELREREPLRFERATLKEVRGRLPLLRARVDDVRVPHLKLARPPRRACVGGCGRAVLGWTYCPPCRASVARGDSLEFRRGDLPTDEEVRRMRRLFRDGLL